MSKFRLEWTSAARKPVHFEIRSSDDEVLPRSLVMTMLRAAQSELGKRGYVATIREIREHEEIVL